MTNAYGDLRTMMSRRSILRTAMTAPGLVILGACALPGQGEAPRRFRLTPKSTFDADLPTVNWSLVVVEPQADRSVDTVRIALMSGGTEMQYYANADWSNRAPAMVQTLLVESFVNSDRIAVVGNDRAGLRPDFRLSSVLREFQAEGTPGEAPTVRVKFDASLVQLPQRDVVGTTAVEQAVPAASDRIEDIVNAYDEALGSVLKNLVGWTLATGNAASATG